MTTKSPVGERPVVVSVAGGLWLALGLVFLLLAVFALQQVAVGLADDPIVLLFAPVFVVVGTVFLVLAQRFRRGRDTRVALAVLGALAVLAALFFFFLLAVPLLLVVVPAVVLQYRPATARWLADAQRSRPTA
jgi:ABC-type Na+ efflux pump permease subunit